MNKIKLIALDLDGTLLNKAGEISKVNIQAIEKAMSKGIQVVFSTGRMYQGTAQYFDILKERTPIITYNGGLIKESHYGKLIKHQGFEKDRILDFYRDVKNDNIHLNIYANDKLYGREDHPFIEEYSQYTKVPYELLKMDSIEDFMANSPVTKLVAIGAENELDNFENFKGKKWAEYFTFARSYFTFLEINNFGVNKGNSLVDLGNILGIETKNMLACGDSRNDSQMLDVVGYPVVMGNAPDYMKINNRFETKTNVEDGVAFAIESFI